MCLIFLSVNKHPKYKLIVAGNRDEFYSRKTEQAHFWNDHQNILAGRDREAGGTWMGISRQGKISMVTNYRDLKNLKSQAPSRGHLVSEYLLNGDEPQFYLDKVAGNGKDYNGFNLIVGWPEALYYYSNYKNGIEKIPDGLHGLSNHLLNTPWPKVQWGLDKFSALFQTTSINADSVLDALRDDRIAPDDQLPDTGVGLERERYLSAMFIKSPGYGSRCSTFISIDRDDQVVFVERTYNLETFDYTTRSFEFEIERVH